MTAMAGRRNAVTIIGAGFGGICMGIKLRRAGIPFTILEKSDRVGGVWRDNTYPGAACDIPSHLYSYSFEPSHDWSRKYGTQPEIQSYIDQCAHKYGVVEQVRFGQAVQRADFDESSSQWAVTLDDGDTVTSRFLVAATGQLSLPADPKFPGLETFGGNVFHSARWDHDYDLRGRRVAVVGTGASAIQFVPQIAPLAAKLYVLQRSAPYVLPKPDRPYTPLEKYLYRHFPAMLVASRTRQYAYHEARVLPLTKGIGVNAIEKAWERYFHAQITDDELREMLRPDYAIGCKRVLISNDWYAALSQWYLRQMLGSANFDAGPTLAFMSGNLCYQIEHHLYPDLPSNRLSEIAVRVRAVCDKYDLPYTTGSFLLQYGKAWRTIAKLSLPNKYLRDTADNASETRSERMFTELEPGFARTDPATGRRRGLKTAISTVRQWRRDNRAAKRLDLTA